MPLILLDDKLKPVNQQPELVPSNDIMQLSQPTPEPQKEGTGLFGVPTLNIGVNYKKAAQDIANAGRYGVEQAIALPDTIMKGIGSLGAGLISKITGVEGPSPEAIAEFHKTRSAGQALPSQESVAEFRKEYLPQYLQKEPETEAEQFLYNTIGSIPGYMLGGAGVGTAAASALGGELGKKAAETMGLGPTGQMLSSMFGSYGANFLANGGTIGGLKKHIEDKYRSFTSSIPDNGRQGTANIQSVVDDIERRLNSREIVHSEAELLREELKHIKKIIKPGNVKIQKGFDETKRLNALMRHPETTDAAKEEILKLSRGFRGDIVSAGQSYPELKTQDLLDANDMYQGMHNIGPVRKIVRKYINPTTVAAAIAGKHVSSVIAKELVGFDPSPYLGQLIIGGAALRGGTEVASALYQSPQIRKWLGNIASQSAVQTAPHFAGMASQLKVPEEKKQPLIRLD